MNTFCDVIKGSRLVALTNFQLHYTVSGLDLFVEILHFFKYHVF